MKNILLSLITVFVGTLSATCFAQVPKILYAPDGTLVYSCELKARINKNTTMKELLHTYDWMDKQIRQTTEKLAGGTYLIKIINVPRSKDGLVFNDSLLNALVADSSYHPATISEVLMTGRAISFDGLTSTAATLPRVCHYRKRRAVMMPPRFKLSWDKGDTGLPDSKYGATIDCGLPKVFGYSPGMYIFIKKASPVSQITF